MRRKPKYYVLVQESGEQRPWLVDDECDSKADAAAKASSWSGTSATIRVIRGYELEVDRQTTVVLR